MIVMNFIYLYLNRWIEVWPYLLPLSIFFFQRHKNKNTRLLFIFTCIAFILSLAGTITWRYAYLFPESFKNNNILYNAGSIVRTVFPALYILQLPSIKPLRYLWYIFSGYILFILLSFFFWDDIFILSTIQHSAESILILIFTISFYLHLIVDDEINLKSVIAPLVFCTGISVYSSVNFFIYLFFYPVLNTDEHFSYKIYNASLYSLVFYWLMTGLAIYLHGRQPVKTIKPATV